MAYQLGELDLHARIFIKTAGFNNQEIASHRGYLLTTVGKIFFNEVFPDDFPYINHADFNRHLPEDNLIDGHLNPTEVLQQVPLNAAAQKGLLADIIARCYRRYGNTKTAVILDSIKQLGFHYATGPVLPSGWRI